ncbi:5'-methylthioadenosine/adenosylhomocysteine nucleosidase [Streptococcus hillyeri]|uniref:5'-methylthioadenosine/S-adenosylhomocysteine nucleosidase n=1 Tax=Streptococcus hillyeri TaxID=2282420 RepID=A0A3L9DW50_9STRE|nr:5'-methylthioadenosine/adenosylhomocysteine nucleosidase [Streptococcus hillyeri]RLY05325.1 5'-methylthioadenosine/adenosylhomocysteine nucleosidase [Streptococcus hillyeri]
MKIGIIAAMEEELRTLIPQLQEVKETEVLGNVYYAGKIAKHEVVLVQSGIGKVMSAMSVAILVDHFDVNAIINTGSAGAIAEGLAVGDVVVANKLAYHDVDVTAFGYALGQMAGQPLYFDSDQHLVSVFEQALKKQSLSNKIGLIATGDSFIASQEKIDTIKAQFPEVLAVEMEGAAIAQAAHNIGKPFVVVRAMSDTANHDANISFDEFIIEAGAKSAQTLLTFLQLL